MTISLLLLSTRKMQVMSYSEIFMEKMQWLFYFQEQPSWDWYHVLFEEQI